MMLRMVTIQRVPLTTTVLPVHRLSRSEEYYAGLPRKNPPQDLKDVHWPDESRFYVHQSSNGWNRITKAQKHDMCQRDIIESKNLFDIWQCLYYDCIMDLVTR